MGSKIGKKIGNDADLGRGLQGGFTKGFEIGAANKRAKMAQENKGASDYQLARLIMGQQGQQAQQQRYDQTRDWEKKKYVESEAARLGKDLESIARPAQSTHVALKSLESANPEQKKILGGMSYVPNMLKPYIYGGGELIGAIPEGTGDIARNVQNQLNVALKEISGGAVPVSEALRSEISTAAKGGTVEQQMSALKRYNNELRAQAQSATGRVSPEGAELYKSRISTPSLRDLLTPAPPEAQPQASTLGETPPKQKAGIYKNAAGHIIKITPDGKATRIE